MVWVPSVPGLGVNVMGQLAEVALTDVNEQVANGLVEESRVKLIEPVGVIGLGEVSFTSARHDEAVSTGNDAGLHERLVVVGSGELTVNERGYERDGVPLALVPITLIE